jgi:putative ABC transport system permease protein
VYANDWLYALRTLRRNPRFTIAAGLTLALGIGANTAIFSFINTVYLRPLPYPRAEQLIMIWETAPKGKGRSARTAASPAAYLEWRKDTTLFTAIGSWGWDVVTLAGGPWPERVQVQRIAGDYLQSLGVQPVLGRAFLPDEESGTDCAILVSSRLWRNWFGGDPGAIGRPVTSDGAPCRVVGVMPERFLPPIAASNRVDVWMPLRLNVTQKANRTDHSLMVLARLAPGITLEQAQRRLDAGSQQVAAAIPQAQGWGVHLIPLKEQIVGTPKKALFALAGAVGFLLLIACINVATLLTARAAGQRREMAIRAALGAGRRRLMAQMLAQTLVLALIGGAGGLLAAYWSMDALVALANGTLPRLNESRIDWRVLAFTAAMSIATGILFGLSPAIGISRANLRGTLNLRGRRRVFGSAQIVAEISLAFILLVGAGLLMRSFQAIRAVDLGFRTEHILSANFALPPSHYSQPQQYNRFLTDVLDRVRALPGVVSATATLGVPMVGSAGGNFEIYGRTIDTSEKPDAAIRPGDSEYLATLGIALERGRSFTSRDVDGAPPVALINEKLARQFFTGANPIGEQIRVAGKENNLPWMTIVGVVRDTRHVGPLRDAMPEIHVPYMQFRSTRIQPRALIVRTAGDAERLLPFLQRAVASVDKDQPLVSVRSMEQNLSDFIAPQRFDTTLMTIFAAIGLVLSAIGIFGVMSYRVARRTQEIGVRMALGAEGKDVLRMVLAEGFRTAALGLALGWIGAWALTRYMASLLYSVKPHDPITLGLVSIVMLGTTAVAAYLPARRAAQLDPMAALREE